MVSISKLHQAERIIDELDPGDRVRLLQYLAPRIVDAVLLSSPPSSAASLSADDPWGRFWALRARIASASNADDGPSLTQTVSDMRR